MNPHIIYTQAFDGLFQPAKPLVDPDGAHTPAFVTLLFISDNIQTFIHGWIFWIILATIAASFYIGTKICKLDMVTEKKHNGPAVVLLIVAIVLALIVYFLFDLYGPRPHPINDPYRPNNLIQLQTNHFYEVFGAGFACALALFAAGWLFFKEHKKHHSHVVAATLAFVCAAQLVVVALLLL